MTKARELANLLGGGTSGVATFGGTAAIRVPNGTTEQRPTAAAGMIRYNTTTGLHECYDGNNWVVFGAPPPTIDTVSPSTYNGESGTTFTIDGANFASDASVFFITSGGTEHEAGAVSVINAGRITATTPQDFTVSDEPLDVKVSQSSGVAIAFDAVDCGGVPSWSTASGTVATVVQGSSVSTQITASDPDAGATISYSVTSGALPSGVNLNSSTGGITGTAPSVASDTTYNFTAAASDNAGNQTSRSFSIIVVQPKIVVNSTEYLLTSPRTFTSQGYYLLVPNANLNVRLQLWGGGGGGSSGGSGPSRGGAGGYVEGEVNLLSGVSYVFLVGQGGRKPPAFSANTNQDTGRSFPDGGASRLNEGYGQAGGGGSTRFGTLSQSGFNLTNTSANYNNTNAVYILIAGAGGGGADYTYGWSGTPSGFGGGTTGSGGGAWYPTGESENATGKGGTQSAGGAGGTTPARLSFSESGAKYYGGDGSGGGGGGGYFGGGGARGYYTIGGGGSGFIGAGVTNGAFYTASAGQSTHWNSANPRSNKPTNCGNGGISSGTFSSVTHGYDGGLIITLL
jgi:hypothetical protein